MGYVDTVLQPGETVRFRTGRHWVVYLPGAAIAVAAAAGLAVALTFYLEADFPTIWDAVWVGVALAFLALGLILLARGWRRRSTEVAVTDRRVIYKWSRRLQRCVSEMPLERIERIDVEQGLLGRLFDYGDVKLCGISSGIEVSNVSMPSRIGIQVTSGGGGSRLPVGPIVADLGSPSVVAAPAQPAVPESAAASAGR